MKKCKSCNIELPYTERNGIKTYKAKYGYGLKCGCYNNWLVSDDPKAKETFKKFLISNKKKVQTEKRKEKRRKLDELDSSSAMKLADIYFSRYIRLKNSKDGLCTCYTCGILKPIKEIDNGHYQKREHKATRYMESNCRTQCKVCNGDTKHNGKQDVFRANLVRELGLKKVESIEDLAKTVMKVNGLFYREIADTYRKKVNELQKELGVKYW